MSDKTKEIVKVTIFPDKELDIFLQKEADKNQVSKTKYILKVLQEKKEMMGEST